MYVYVALITSTAGDVYTHRHTHVEVNNKQWGSTYTNLQFLNVWDPKVHEILFLAFLVVPIAVLGGGEIYHILTGKVL